MRSTAGWRTLRVVRVLTALTLLFAACRPHASPRVSVEAGASTAPAPVDGGVEASAPSTWTTHTVDGCRLQIADDAAHAATGIVWRPCAGTGLPAGACQELGAPDPQTLLFATGAFADGGTIVMIRSTVLFSGDGERYVLGPPDGPPRLVMKLKCPTGTAAGPMVVGADGAALEIATAHQFDFLAGPFAPSPAWAAPAARISEAKLGETILDQPFALAGRSVRAVDARERVLRSSPSTGDFTTWRAGPAFRSTIGHAVARGDTTLFLADSIPEVVGIQRGSSPPAVWYAPPAGGGVSAPALDGATVYFLQGRGRDKNNHYTGIDLFSAPLAAAAPSPRRLAPTSAQLMPDPIAGGGHVAWRVWLQPDRSAVDVLDVASGKRVRFTPPQGRTTGRLVFVDAQELGVEVVDAATARSMSAHTWTWRLRLDALPSP